MLDEQQMYQLLLYAYVQVHMSMLGRDDYRLVTSIDGDTAELRIMAIRDAPEVMLLDIRVIKGRRFRKATQIRRIENVLSRLHKEGAIPA